MGRTIWFGASVLNKSLNIKQIQKNDVTVWKGNVSLKILQKDSTLTKKTKEVCVNLMPQL